MAPSIYSLIAIHSGRDWLSNFGGVSKFMADYKQQADSFRIVMALSCIIFEYGKTDSWKISLSTEDVVQNLEFHRKKRARTKPSILRLLEVRTLPYNSFGIITL